MEETYNPIGQTKEYENGVFSQIPIPTPGYANVLTGGKNEGIPLVIQSQDIPRKEQIRQGKYRWRTPVDVQPHKVSFETKLLSNDNISYFHLTVDMTARVEAPGQVCLDNITDVAAAVKSALLPELQAKAIQYNADDIHQLRNDIGSWLKDVISLNSGIQLADIRAHIQPDQAYIKRKELLRQEEQEKEDRLRKLQETKEYEIRRAEVSDELSKVYSSDMTRVFAELASGAISPEEASKRVEARRKSQSIEKFDEGIRQMKEVLALVKMMQDNGMGSPDMLAQKTDQLLESLFTPSITALNGGNPCVQALESAASEQVEESLYAPPSDD